MSRRIDRIDYVELLTSIKKAVNSFEDILETTKTVLNEVRAYGYSENIAYIVRKLERMYNKLLETVDGIVIDNSYGDNELLYHLTTLIDYIVHVNIAYQEDLLTEMREYVRDNKQRAMIDKALSVSNNIRNLLNNLIYTV